MWSTQNHVIWVWNLLVIWHKIVNRHHAIYSLLYSWHTLYDLLLPIAELCPWIFPKRERNSYSSILPFPRIFFFFFCNSTLKTYINIHRLLELKEFIVCKNNKNKKLRVRNGKKLFNNFDKVSLTGRNYEQFRWYLHLIINLTKLMKLITCSYFTLNTNIPFES